MNTKIYTVVYIAAETGNLTTADVESFGSLPALDYARDVIEPLAKPGQPIHVFLTDEFGSNMCLNWPSDNQDEFRHDSGKVAQQLKRTS